MDNTILTVRLPAELQEKLDALAHHTQRSASFLAAEAIAEYVAREAEIVAGIERGLDDMRAARVVGHDEAMQRVRTTIDRARSSR